jgi:hypothetical protein
MEAPPQLWNLGNYLPIDNAPYPTNLGSYKFNTSLHVKTIEAQNNYMFQE